MPIAKVVIAMSCTNELVARNKILPSQYVFPRRHFLPFYYLSFSSLVAKKVTESRHFNGNTCTFNIITISTTSIGGANPISLPQRQRDQNHSFQLEQVGTMLLRIMKMERGIVIGFHFNPLPPLELQVPVTESIKTLITIIREIDRETNKK